MRPNVTYLDVPPVFPLDGVSLDYRGYDGKPVRTHFRFNDAGKITLTGFATIKQVA
jgi:hypothetical protein